MKKKIPGIIILAFCLVLVLAATSACYAVGNAVSDAVTAVIEEVNFAIDDYSNFGEAIHMFDMPADLVSHLDINLRVNAIRLISTNDTNIRIAYTPSLRGNYVVPQVEGAIVDGRLSVTEEPASQLTNINGGVLRIYVPRNLSLNTLNMSTYAGAISIFEGGYLADTVTLRASAGAISIEDFTAISIIAETTSGLVTARGLNAISLNMQTSAGAIFLSDSSIEGELTATTSVGAINISNVDADFDNANISTSVGIVNINP